MMATNGLLRHTELGVKMEYEVFEKLVHKFLKIQKK